MKLKYILPIIAILSTTVFVSAAQVNSGSNGSDGAFNPTANVTVDMTSHPNGIYQYTSVDIPSGVTVTFKPNANNTPVVWLVSGNCTVSGIISVSGQGAPVDSGIGALGGVGGWAGGSGGDPSSQPGQGPGGGPAGASGGYGSGGSFGGQGTGTVASQTYGNAFLVPLLGGSGGGGDDNYSYPSGGGGGGGAILIAVSGTMQFEGGTITAAGGSGSFSNSGGSQSGAGSGGGIRLVATSVQGTGSISAPGGGTHGNPGGVGRVRIDALINTFSGEITGAFTQGYQPIIIPAAGQGVQLSIQSIGGVTVSGTPSGILSNPDVIVPAQQNNPIPVVVACTNLPLNTQITLNIDPANASPVQATGINNVGTTASSTATIAVNMPRGGGIIYADCVSGVAGLSSNASAKDLKTKTLAQTGWTSDGERFIKMKITAALGGSQRIAYITESGKTYSLPGK